MAVAKKPGSGRPPKDPNSKTQQRAARRTAENLRDDAKAFRDRFVTEYLYDFNATHAYIRAGGTARRASKAAYEIRHEAYVSQQIQQAIDNMKVGNIVNQQRALAWAVREANHYGPDASHGARVSMVKTLMQHTGLSMGDKEAVTAARGGVMVVPATDTVDGWEARAAAAQAALKEQVRD